MENQDFKKKKLWFTKIPRRKLHERGSTKIYTDMYGSSGRIPKESRVEAMIRHIDIIRRNWDMYTKEINPKTGYSKYFSNLSL